MGVSGNGDADARAAAPGLPPGQHALPDRYALYVSLEGEPMHEFGAPITQAIDGPFYVGIGFCSHLPDTVDTAVISNVVLENAGKVR